MVLRQMDRSHSNPQSPNLNVLYVRLFALVFESPTSARICVGAFRVSRAYAAHRHAPLLLSWPTAHYSKTLTCVSRILM